ncbi:MAG: manganese catalase family protein [Oscillospiraceae bacterium]|nr:manganese catalase family protein [Oscillospiraceae bacterium]
MAGKRNCKAERQGRRGRPGCSERQLTGGRSLTETGKPHKISKNRWCAKHHRFLPFGGPDGELGASMRYLSQRFAMPYPELKGLLTDIGTEELGHLEMVGTIVHQLTRSMKPEEIKKAGFDAYFVDHTAGVYPTAASGFPWNAASIGVKGDVITDLTEDMGAEQKARTTYDNILRLCDDPDVSNVIRFLREREVVHFQRFGEGLRLAMEKMDGRNFYAVNPAFD